MKFAVTCLLALIAFNADAVKISSMPQMSGEHLDLPDDIQMNDIEAFVAEYGDEIAAELGLAEVMTEAEVEIPDQKDLAKKGVEHKVEKQIDEFQQDSDDEDEDEHDRSEEHTS